MIRGRYDLRKLITEQGYPREVVNTIDFPLKDLDIKVVSDYFDYEKYLQIIWKIRLLPSDAQIVLTCKHYRINTILTFNENFKRAS